MRIHLHAAAVLSLLLCAAAAQAAPPPVDMKRTAGTYECIDGGSVSGMLRISDRGVIRLNTMDAGSGKPCAFTGKDCRVDGRRLICVNDDEPDAEIRFAFSTDYRRVNVEAGEDARRAYCGKHGTLGNFGSRYARKQQGR